MVAARVIATAVAAAAIVWLMLDSGLATAEPAPPMTSASLGGLGLLFTVGGGSMMIAGQRERGQLPLGLGIGLVVYAVVRLFL